MDYKITAPNKNYTGESAGVNFINGEGIAKDGKSIDWFEKKGYEVEPIEDLRELITPTKESKAQKNKKESKEPEESKEQVASAGDLDDSAGNSSVKTEA